MDPLEFALGEALTQRGDLGLSMALMGLGSGLQPSVTLHACPTPSEATDRFDVSGGVIPPRDSALSRDNALLFAARGTPLGWTLVGLSAVDGAELVTTALSSNIVEDALVTPPNSPSVTHTYLATWHRVAWGVLHLSNTKEGSQTRQSLGAAQIAKGDGGAGPGFVDAWSSGWGLLDWLTALARLAGAESDADIPFFDGIPAGLDRAEEVLAVETTEVEAFFLTRWRVSYTETRLRVIRITGGPLMLDHAIESDLVNPDGTPSILGLVDATYGQAEVLDVPGPLDDGARPTIAIDRYRPEWLGTAFAVTVRLEGVPEPQYLVANALPGAPMTWTGPSRAVPVPAEAIGLPVRTRLANSCLYCLWDTNQETILHIFPLPSPSHAVEMGLATGGPVLAVDLLLPFPSSSSVDAPSAIEILLGDLVGATEVSNTVWSAPLLPGTPFLGEV